MSDEQQPQETECQGPQPEKRRTPPPRGTGIAIGICLGVGLGLPLQNPLLGLSVGVAFAAAFETAFRNQRNAGDR